MGFLEEMAQFDLRQGKPPINPTRIEGFGPDAPPPALAPEDLGPEIPSAAESYGEPIEPQATQEPVPVRSPLIEAGLRRTTPEPEPVGVPQAGGVELWVTDQHAMFRGRSVNLTEDEKKDISKVVLKAIRRSLDEQYQEVAGVKPRRRSGATTSAESSSVPSTSTPRTRVRRKSLLKDGAK